MKFRPGSRLGRYEIVERMGAGGMGEVYRALDKALFRPVAVKVLRDDIANRGDGLVRFEREARAVAAMSHPNIVTIHDIGREGNTTYAVMELLEGRSLAEEILTSPAPVPVVVDRCLQMARGLEAAHSCGVIHRDLKPENVFLTASGLVKILDFGIALFDGGSRGLSLEDMAAGRTDLGKVVGSPRYVSPEQVDGEGVDHRTDLFNFGLLLVEMLKGEHPFARRGGMATLSAIVTAEPNLEFYGRIPPALGMLARSCLQKNAADRIGSASEVVRALERLQAVEARTASPAVAAVHRPSLAAPAVAVLPFVDMSPGGDQRYFCEGMAEEIISALSDIVGLRVAARTSTFRFDGRTADVQDVGMKLGVNRVVEGSVRSSGERLRVAVRLVDADEGHQLWAEQFDRESSDVLDVQDEISAKIVASLRATLTGPVTKGDDQGLGAGLAAARARRAAPEDLDAYRLFLKGRYFRYTEDNPMEAIACFEAAVERVPTYVRALAGLAEAYVLAGNCCYVPPLEAYARARQEVDAALALEDTSPEATHVDAVLRFLYDRDWRAAEVRFHETLRRLPDYIPTLSWYALFLTVRGRHEEAVRMVERAAAVDPLSPYAAAMVGLVTLHGGDPQGAIAEFERALSYEKGYIFALSWLGIAQATVGLYDQAIESLQPCVQASGGTSYYLSMLGWANAVAGHRLEARAILAECEDLARKENAVTFGTVWLTAALGDVGRAWELFDRAHRERQDMMLFLDFPALDPLRSDPRFDPVLSSVRW